MKRLALLLIVVVLTVGSSVPAMATSSADVKKNQQDLQRVKSMIKQVEQQKKANANQQKSVLNKIGTLNDQIDVIQGQVSSLQGKIQETSQSINVKAQELKNAENGISNKKVIINARLRVMYETGPVGYLEVLLGSADFKDLLSRIDALRIIYKHDMDMVHFMVEQRNIIQRTKVELEARKATYHQLVGEKQAAQVNMNSKVGELEVTKKQLAKDYASMELQEDRMQQDANKITRLLQNLQPSGNYVGGIMNWPTPGHRIITQAFGYSIHPILKKRLLHTGIDIGVPTGTTVVAAQSGKVIMAGWYGGYGKTVMIDHGGGIVTLYGHNSQLLVNVGDKVTRAQPISHSGSTGLSTGPHLHFEVRVSSQPTDPMKYVSPQ